MQQLPALENCTVYFMHTKQIYEKKRKKKKEGKTDQMGIDPR